MFAHSDGAAERMDAHTAQCTLPHPPGSCIYQANDVALYEVDAARHMLFGQLLSLLAKVWLDHKVLLYNVHQFVLYVLTVGRQVAGYFSKAKRYSPQQGGHNLSCICVWPPHQRKGLARFLVAASYEISRR